MRPKTRMAVSACARRTIPKATSSRSTRFTEFRRGSIPGLPRVGIGEIGEEGSPRVLDEEARELGAGVVPGPHNVAYAGHGRSFRRPHDDARHRFQEPVSFLDGEGQLAPRTTARQFAREGESGRPDHEERDEPADDQEIREPDLVELAVVPEPGDEDEGDQKQESGADQECPEAGVHRAHPIARATSNRPFSKRSVWSSLSWFTLRIFTHWKRRWNEVSVTGSRRRWRIPSARNSSSNAVGGASRAGSSEISRLVTPRSRSRSKKQTVSARRSANSRTSSRASHESIARSRKFRFLRSSKIFAFRTARSASPRGAVVSAIDPTLETISSRYSRPRLR